MPSANAFQTNFSAGELSPRLYGRVDVGKYANACQKLENFITLRWGGIKKRGGTEYINEVKTSSKKVRVIPFIFSVTQAYVLEFGDLYVRFYTNGGVVESGGSPVEVVTPWDEDEVFELQFAQSADVLYITHPNFAPRTLSRTSATTFVLDTIDFEDGPFLEINTTGTTLTPAATGAVHPKMTAATTPSGTAAAGTGTAWQAFDQDKATDWQSTYSDYLSYEFGGGITKVCDAYYIRSIGYGDPVAPTAWEFQGYNGSAWVTLDSRQAESGWARGEVRFYEFTNDTAYESYRIKFSGSEAVANLYLAETGWHEKAENQTAFNLTASSTAGINDGSGFLTTDVGRAIRLLGSDGKWRWAKVVSRSSSTVVTVQLYGHALPDLSPIVNWRLGAWSDQTGWPGSVGFYSGRLCFARTALQPQTVWMSVVDDFTNFTVSDPIQDDDAITATIASDSLNEIKWIAEGTDLFVGTTAAIRTIGPTAASSAFSPTNIRQKRETSFGASEVAPVRVGSTALYSGYYRKDMREISYSFDFNGYVSQDLSLLSEHICLPQVKQIAYAQNPDSIVWMVLDDGTLAGMTYERDQEVIAFHRHSIAGTAVTVESVCTIPGSLNDEVWFVVKRTIGGSTKRYVERLSEGLYDNVAKESATYLDSFQTYSGTSTTTLSGLAHLNGQSVYVWGTGGQQGPFTVSAGAITITTAVTQACVGLLYTATMETLSPEAAAAGGTAQAQLGKINEVFVRVNRSMFGSIGPNSGTLESFNYTNSNDVDGVRGTGTDLFSGDVRVPIEMNWNRAKRMKLTHSNPTPFHVLGIVSGIRVSG